MNEYFYEIKSPQRRERGEIKLKMHESKLPGDFCKKNNKKCFWKYSVRKK
jgi:hypothetical protein